MSERFCLEGNEIKDNGFFLSGKVQYTEVMNRLNNNINQLKQQLEEKDEQIKKRVMVYEKQFIEQTDEIYSLKQQLAEAEEYIENDEVTKREYYQKTDEIIAEKDKELLEFKRNKLYFELLITRLQWLHKRADEYKEEKERFGIDEEISLSSVWDVLSLQKNNICEYEEMCELQEGIECIANSRLLKDIEHDLQIKATRKEDEIFKEIEQIDNQIKKLKGE